MNDSQKKAALKELNAAFPLKDAGIFVQVHENFDPHPYCITPAHLAVAAKQFSGMLSRESIAAAEKQGVRCGEDKRHSPCKLSLDEHKVENIPLLQLQRDCGEKELADALFAITGILRRLELAGVGFLTGEFQVMGVSGEVRLERQKIASGQN